MFFERIHNIFNWGDKLTRYNGETITYDEIGNPLSYRDGMEMTWLNGRKLTTLQSGNDSISYKYDSNGVITSKTVNGVEYTYEYLNGHLMHETRGEKVFDYCYDANGQLYAVSYKANSSTDAVTYYYAHNWRGDITSIYDGDGNVVANYEYDAMTTIEELNATGVVYAYQDSLTHVTVKPIGGTIAEWRNQGTSSVWIKTIKSLVVKWDGSE